LADHRRILRRLCAQHGGDEVRTTGDGYFAVFDDAAAAVEAAVDAQLALRSNDWPTGCEIAVRMGLHTGEAEVDTEDLNGVAIHAAARVCAAAHGGQIVVSAITASAAPGRKYKSLGAFPLKASRARWSCRRSSTPICRTTFPRRTSQRIRIR
ncbi:MAG: adenylate/guanylate cyclase domain-containing protein, partial [Acidimicrobiales bacterium]|nr:adenylate/guanylate cyclase domain-containing protein [Acidimicrobiales bacterium]